MSEDNLKGRLYDNDKILKNLKNLKTDIYSR